MAKRALLLLAIGFEEIEAISIADVLRRAGVEVVLASLDELLVRGAHNIAIKADILLAEVDESIFDVVILPGGLPGAYTLAQSPLVQKTLQYFDAQKKMIGAICAAPLALKTAGVLKNAYTCYPSFETQIEHQGYQKEPKVVCDGNITTSQGPATSILFALKLVEQLCGEKVSLQLKKDLLLD